jgi:hypothetical protein
VAHTVLHPIRDAGRDHAAVAVAAHSGDLDQLFQRISIKRSGRTRSVA